MDNDPLELLKRVRFAHGRGDSVPAFQKSFCELTAKAAADTGD